MLRKENIMKNNYIEDCNFYFCTARDIEQMSEESLKQLSDYDWRLISRVENLSLEFIDKYADFVIWSEISLHQELPEYFIEKFADKVNWIFISQYQKLSEEFIEKFQDKVCWSYISRKQALSEKFISKFNCK